MPTLSSAKSMMASSPTCIRAMRDQIHGRARRHSASGAKPSSSASAPHVATASSPPGSDSNASRIGPGRASGLSRIRTSAVPSSHDGLISLV